MINHKRPRVLLADDHALVMAGLSKLLEPDHEVLGAVSDGRSLVATAHTTNPDVVLTDISMPILNGLEAARQIRDTLPACKIVFLTVHSDGAYVKEAFRAGASGYLLKQSAASELPTAIQEVLNNNVYVTPLIKQDSFTGLANGDNGHQSQLLSSRQREVLQLVAEGHSAKGIGSILKISSKTVEFHKGSIMKKLDLHTTAQLTRYAIQHQITG